MARPQLILTVTRRCDLRCAYCPTVKEGLPDLGPGDVRRALDLFAERHPEGDVKLFGGEPLLVRDAVIAALSHARNHPGLRLSLSTNATRLDDAFLDVLEAHPEVTLTVSVDGRPEDHSRLRRPLHPGGPDSHAAVLKWLPRLLRLPRLVVTQTIAPVTAARAWENFRYLRGLGFRRFNLLPGYYLPWREAQLQALARGFAGIAEDFEAAWERGERLYLRNLFTRAQTPFFNTGFVVDCDRTIHPSNLILAGSLDALRRQTAVGTLDHPPEPEALQAAQARVPALLREHLPEAVLESTRRVDALLTALCHRLYPAYVRRRLRERAA